jgi:hypothetical protein
MQKFKQNETTATYRRIYMFLASAADGYTAVTSLVGATVNLFRNGVAFGSQPTTPASLTHISVGHWYYEIPQIYLSDLGILTVTVQDTNIRPVVLMAEVVDYNWYSSTGATAAQVWSYADRQLTASLDPTASQIWSNATRTLTASLDPTASQIWANATRTLTASLDPTAATIADAVWDEAYSAHKTAGTFGKLMDTLRKSNYVTEGIVTSAVTATTTTFSTNLTNEDGSLDHQSLLFLTGDHVGTSIPVLNYSLANGLVQLEETLHAPPATGDEFVILPQHVHSVIGIAAGVWNELSTGYNTANTFGKILKDLSIPNTFVAGAVTGVINATYSSFSTNLTALDDTYDHQTIVFTSGNLLGQSVPVDTFTQTNGLITTEEPLTYEPQPGDTFAILPVHVHSKVKIADAFLSRLLDSSGSSNDVMNERTVRSALRAMRNKVIVDSGNISVYKEDDVTAAWEGSVSNITDVTVNPDGGS